ncbi:MAG TPA: ABC transporter ATP-binding protein, partial [Sorangium sp.]|nr:ABC transporter ATP-binding protein [Sorangium sp.]
EGSEYASDGEIVIATGTRLGVLKQDRYLSDEQRILDAAMMGDREVWQALQDKATLLTGATIDAQAIADAEERIAIADGYTLDARAAATLVGLGISTAQHQLPLATLSGGFKLRVLLAQTLVGRPDVLLLDEPTNHLDIVTIAWLEDFIRRYEGCAVVVSHDHRFLDNVATHILDVDYGTVVSYPGNYSKFVKQKRSIRTQKEAQIARQQQIIADKKAFVEKFRAKATKARQAQSRLKQIERIQVEELARSSRRAPRLCFEQRRRSGRDVLTLAGVHKAYDDKVVLTDVSLTVRRGERIAVIGANGLGKSTLLRIAVERLAPDAGRVEWGHEVVVGYFAQDHRELLSDPKVTVLNYLWDYCADQAESFVRGQLGNLLFTGQDVEKPVGSLSGGEAARLIFSRILVQRPNVLVLDEPTNHLDLEAIEALLTALEGYPGTLLFVSHNRWFVSRLAKRIIELREDGIVDFPGSYDEYVTRADTDHLDDERVLLKARQQRAEQRAAKAAEGNAWQAQKQRRSNVRKLETKRDKLTAAIDKAEARQKEITNAYCTAGFFENTPPDTLAKMQQEERELGEKIDVLIAQWEKVETELEVLAE